MHEGTMKTKTNILKEQPKLVGAADRILERYLTVRDAAEFLRVSEASIRLALTKKRLPHYKFGARTLIKLSDAEAQIRQA
jgi:excisionase family DNA binding protein